MARPKKDQAVSAELKSSADKTTTPINTQRRPTTANEKPLTQMTRLPRAKSKANRIIKNDSDDIELSDEDVTKQKDSDGEFKNDGKNSKKRVTKAEQDRMEREKDLKKRPWAYEKNNGNPRKRTTLDYDQYWKKIVFRDAEIQRLTDLKKTAEKKRRALQDELGEANKEKGQLEEELLETQSKLAKRIAAIQKLADERLGTFKKGDDPITLDNEVQAAFTHLFDDIKTWAEDWAAEKIGGGRREQSSAIWNQPLDGDHTPFASELTVEAALEGKVPTMILLNGLVNHLVCHYTFGRPFAFLKTNGQGGYDDSAQDKVEWLLDLAMEESSTAAQGLRRSIMRVLRGQDASDEPVLLSNPRKQIEDLKAKHHSHIVDTVLRRSEPLLHLLNEAQRMQCKKELYGIVGGFIDLSIALNAEKPKIEVWLRKDVSRHDFEQKHKYFSGHRGLKLKEDKSDDSPTAEEAGIAGRKIDFFVEPTVVRYGNVDGESMQQDRVLRKGTVWMVKPVDIIKTLKTALTQPNVQVLVGESSPNPQRPAQSETIASTTSNEPSQETQQAEPGLTSKEARKLGAVPTSTTETRSKKRGSLGEEPLSKKVCTSKASVASAAPASKSGTEGSTASEAAWANHENGH